MKYSNKHSHHPHILFFSHSSSIAGAERSLADLVAELAGRAKYNCSVILPNDGPLRMMLEKAGARVYLTDHPYGWWIYSKSSTNDNGQDIIPLATSFEVYEDEIVPLVHRINPDVIYTQTMVIPWGSMTAKRLAIPHILSVREYGELDQHFGFYFGFPESMDALYHDSDMVFCITKDVLETVFVQQKKEDEFKNKTAALYGSIDIGEWIDDTPFNGLSEKKQINIIIPATIASGKGQLDAVEALTFLMNKPFKIKLILVGYENPEYGKTIREYINKQKLEDMVKFIPPTVNNIELIKNADMVLSTARFEALGRTHLEAALLKKPFIYVDTAGPHEIYRPGEHGLTYAVGNAKELAQRIEETIIFPKKTAERVGKVYNLVKNDFSNGAYIKRIVPVIEKLLAQDNTSRHSAKSKTKLLFEEIDYRDIWKRTSLIAKNQIEEQQRKIGLLAADRHCALYFDTGSGYSGNEMQVFSFSGNEVNIDCILPNNIKMVRLDPVEGYGCVVSNLEIMSYGGIVNYESLNGYKDKSGNIVFTNTDPQIELQGASFWLKVKYRILLLSEFSHYRVLGNYIQSYQERDNLIGERDNLIGERDNLIGERDNLIGERDNLIGERDNLIGERDNLIGERDNLIGERDSLLGSRSWRFTKPLRQFTTSIRRNKILYLCAKGLLSIKRNGFTETLRKVIFYRRRQLHLPSSETTALLYDCEYQKNIDYSGYEPRVKAIAFYLPQFHTIPENDEWWGKGFTEWTNTRKARPRFAGHYQPREPHKDIGYYNLTNIETLKKQTKLARQHGIYGFCFYLYWFSGKRLLEKPLDLFLEHPEIDINFCLCWANENWTRTWDGQDKEVLISQNYSNEDPYRFIEDIQKYINDKRYIRINGEPVILVYNPGHIPNVKETFNIWKNYALEIGIGKIRIYICNIFGNTSESLNITDVVDGEIEFPPNNIFNIRPRNISLHGENAFINDYKEAVSLCKQRITESRDKNTQVPLYRTCMMGWDNAARRISGWTIFAGFSLKYFYDWISTIVEESENRRNSDESYIFINAWNEWAEGTYLEPDRKYGYAIINSFSKAICGISFYGNELKPIPNHSNRNIIFVSHDAWKNGAQLLSLNIIRQLRETFGYDVYVILKGTGTMLEDFRKLAKKLICLETDNLSAHDLKDWIRATNANKAMCNTVVTGDILRKLTESDIICISMIHEMENVIRQYSHEENLSTIADYAAKIVFASEYVKESAGKVRLIPQKKTVVYPQGMYTLNPYLKERNNFRLSIRSEYHLPLDCKIILGVGYGYYRKGIDLFVDCMLKVCKSNKNVYFMWIGDIEQTMLSKVKDILGGSHLEENLILTGWKSDVMKFYIAADLYLLTSREDPFPTVVLEAMYAYLPVIAFEGGGGYVEVVNEKTGILVEMENSTEMAERTIAFLEDEKYRLATGRFAHDLAAERFNFIGYVQYLLSLLDENYKKVSVIVPNYNYGKYLKQRINSILRQTYPIFEIIILDDCSTDDSQSIISEYETSFPLRIKVLQNEKNSGNVFTQWAKGLEMAKGDYVWIAEADDLSDNLFLETLLTPMAADENIVMGYTQSKIIDENSNVIGENYLFYTDKVDPAIWHSDYVSDGKEEIEKRLSIMNTILNVSSVLFKNRDFSAILEKVKQYQVAGDWRFYVELLKDEGKILYIAKSLNYHRRHTNSVTTKFNAQRHFNEVCEVQEYIYQITNNFNYFEKAIEYRKELKEALNLNRE